jgi:hypothetical protein
MDALPVARALSAARVALGAAMIVAPDRAVSRWIGVDAGRPGTQVVVRAFGARDVFLGLLGAHVAGRPGVGRRTIASLGILDAFDAGVTLAERRAIPPSGVAMLAALGGGGALAHVLAARGLPEA